MNGLPEPIVAVRAPAGLSALRDDHRRRTAVSWLVVGVGCLLMNLACTAGTQAGPAAPPQAPTVSERDATKAAAQAELQALDRCTEPIDSLAALPESQQARAIRDAQPALAACVERFEARCAAPMADDERRRFPALRIQAVVSGCRQRYCSQWDASARPRMCDEGSTEPERAADPIARRADAHEFIAAILAYDYQRPRTDVTIERVARRLSPRWAPEAVMIVLSPPSEPPPADPLALRVKMTDSELVLTGIDIEPIVVPMADLEALGRQARSLKDAHPGAHQVVLHASPTVLMKTVVEVMDVLRGDCGESIEMPGCLFPHVTFDTSE